MEKLRVEGLGSEYVNDGILHSETLWYFVIALDCTPNPCLGYRGSGFRVLVFRV